ncbi:MAG: PQQ-binding-like beta-propeller repeat protein [Candidatus Omnitrophica bacterium]|nr:PQQ-binding-like beta-propeller repeat protein [Candidatus Omnitrophota bacterium]
MDKIFNLINRAFLKINFKLLLGFSISLTVMLVCFDTNNILAGTNTYDFSTGAGINKWGYESGVSAKPPAANNLPSSATMTYSNISTDNSIRETAISGTNGIYPAQRFKFTITETESTVEQINVLWNGIGDGKTNDGVELYIWDYSGNAYVFLNSTGLASEVNLTGSLSVNCANYIDSDGSVQLLAVGIDVDRRSLISTDYVKVDIITNDPPTVTINSAAQKTDGSGEVSISIEADDLNENNSRVSIYYGLTALTCTNKATMTGIATADIIPVPDINTANVYQVGDTTPIKTAGVGANTITFNWNTKIDLPDIVGTYFIKIVINDEKTDCLIPPTISTNIDNVNPTNPAVPASGYRTLAKIESISNNTWQNDDNDPYFEWSGANDTGSGVSGYSVYWGTDSNGEPGLIQEQTEASYQVGSPTGDGTFYLRLRTFDNQGNYSSLLTVFIFKYDNTNPISPSAPAFAWQASSKIYPISNDTWQDADNTPYFEWSGSNDGSGSGVSGYSVYWGIDSNGEPGLIKEQSANNYQVALGTAEGTYYLRVRAFDNFGLYSPDITLFIFKYDINAPTNPIASCSAWDSSAKGTAISDNTAQGIDQTPYFEWSGAADGNGQGVSGYSVYFGVSPVGEPGIVQEQAGVSYNVSTPTGEDTYYLRVRTFDSLGHYSNPLTLFTFIYDGTKPTVMISVLPNPTGHRAQGELRFVLMFSEEMDIGAAPIISYDPAGAIELQPVSFSGVWSTTTNPNDTYTVYNTNIIDSSTGDGIAVISVSAAQDIAGNIIIDDTDDTFDIDTTVDHFEINHDGQALVDIAEDIMITAKNITNCTVLDFTGNIILSTLNETGEITWALNTGSGSFNDNGAGVDTATYTYSALDNGVVILQVTDSAADILDVEVTDSIHIDNDTEGGLTISTTALGSFVIAHDTSATAGIAETITITAKDTGGQTKTDYAGTVMLDTTGTATAITWAKSLGGGSFSDGGPVADTASYTFHDNDNGVAVFTITDTKVETINISAVDGAIIDDNTEGNLTLVPGEVDHFVISHDNAAIAGTADNVGITVYDAFNNIKTDYIGTITVDTDGDPNRINWANVDGSGTFTDNGAEFDTAVYTFIAGDAGTVTLSINDTAAESLNISVNGDGKSDDNTEGNLIVSPAVIDYFVIAHDASANAGVPENITVTAKDVYGNNKTDYTGTITLDTNGTAASIAWALKTGIGLFADGGASADTATYTFDLADNGSAVFSITDIAQEVLNILVSGNGKTDNDNEGSLTIGAPVIQNFVVIHDGTANAGVIENITITAKDSLGNTMTSYNGTITVDTNGTANTIAWSLVSGLGTFNDNGASVDTCTYTFSALDNGTAILGINDTTQEIIDIDVLGDSKTDNDTEGNLEVGAALLSYFLINHDTTATAGIGENLTITAKDTVGNTKTDYIGTITVDTNGTADAITWAIISGNGSFADGGAEFDTATYTYDLTDSGVVILSLNDTKAEMINISVSGDGKTDNNTEGDLAVSPGVIDHFRIFHDTSGIAGIAEPITIYARDANENTLTSYTGSITIDTTGTVTAVTWALQSGVGLFVDGGASVDTATYTFSGADNGTVVLNCTDTSSESINISVAGDGKIDDDLEGNLVINPPGTQSTGLRSAAANSGTFTSPANAYVNNSIFATSLKNEVHNYYNYGNSLPYNAIILGFEARIDGKTSRLETGTKAQYYALELSWNSGLNYTSTGYKTPALTTTESTYTLGSATDTWGRTWTKAEINDTNFRVRVIADSLASTRSFLLDWIPVNVYYEIGASSTSNSVISTQVGAGQTDNLILDITITNSAGSLDTVTAITVNNTGTAADSEISAVKLYYDSNNSGDYTTGVDTQIGSGTFASGTKTFTGFNVNIAADGGTEEFFVVFDIASNAVVGKIIDAAIPVNGISLTKTGVIEQSVLNSAGTRQITRMLDHFVISHDGAGIAGGNEQVSITAKDAYGNVITNYTGTITLDTNGTSNFITWSLQSGYGSFNDGGAGVDTATYAFNVADNGAAVFNMNDTLAETLNISVTGDSKSDDNTEGNLVINPAVLDHFVVLHDTAAIAGIADNVTVTAKDAYENTLNDFAGTITLNTTGTPTVITWQLVSGFGIFNDGGASVDTANYTYVPADSGAAIFSITDIKAEVLNISITGDGKLDDNTEGDLAVSPGVINYFVVSHDNQAVADIAESIIITAKDVYANTKYDYTGTIAVDTTGTATTITWANISGAGIFNDNGAGFDTASYTYDLTDNGVVTLSIIDIKTETINISVAGDAKTDNDAEGNLVFIPGDIDHFVISHDGVATTGISEQITIYAYDANNNIKDDYTGTITLDTTGTATTIAWSLYSGSGTFVDGGTSVDTAIYTFADIDNGVVVLNILDYTAETINISVLGNSKTDDDTEGTLNIASSGLDHFVITHDGNAIVGTAESITITAKNANGDTLQTYQGQITVDTTGTDNSIAWALQTGNGSFIDGNTEQDTCTYQFSAVDNGVVVLNITDAMEETINISVSGEGKTDDNTELNLIINPDGLHHFILSHDGIANSGVSELIVITAKDANNVTLTSYTGTITVDTNGTASAITWAKVSGGGAFAEGGASVDTATYTYVSGDLGAVSLSINDTKKETINISVAGDSKSDDNSEGNLVVSAGAIDHFLISHDNSAIQNVAEQVSITAKDLYGNTKDNYLGTILVSTLNETGEIIWSLQTGGGVFSDAGTGIDSATYGYIVSDAGIVTLTLSCSQADTLNIAVIGDAKTDDDTEGTLAVQASSVTADAVANPVTTASVTAGATDILILDLTITNNNVLAGDTITSVTLNNTGTISDSEISSVKLYYDSNNSGDYTSGVDAQVGSGIFSGGSKTFSGLSISLAQIGTEDLFVVVDLNNNVNEGDIIDIEIPVNGIVLSNAPAIKSSVLNSAGTRFIELILDHFVIAHDGAASAGLAELVTVTAKDIYENILTSYDGLISLNTNGTGDISWSLSSGLGSFVDAGGDDDTAIYTFNPSDNGSAVFAIIDELAETINISVTGGGKLDNNTEGNLVISPNVLDHFDIDHDTAAVAGIAEQVTVRPHDQYHNVIEDYTGSITLDTNGSLDTIGWAIFAGFGTFNDDGAGADTATYTFSSSDNSTAVFTITDTSAESIDISITGDGKTDLNDEGNLVFAPAGLDHFLISHDNVAQAGIADNITIIAKDEYGNTISNYAGQIIVDTDGTAASIGWANVSGTGVFADNGLDSDTAIYTYTASDNGIVVLSITDAILENLNISVSGDLKIDDDTEGLLSVGPGLIDHFSITHDGFALQNAPENIMVDAYDAFGNQKTDYVGMIILDTSSTGEITWATSGAGIFNDNGIGNDTAVYTFDLGDNGSALFTMTDDTAETINLSVTGDSKSDDDNEGELEVVAAGFHHFKITHDGNAVANVPEHITITAKDVSDVTVSNYVGTMTIDTNGTASAINWTLNAGSGVFNDDGAAVDTATYTFNPVDNGVVILDITNTQTETLNIAVSGSGKIDDNTEGNLVINPAGLHHFSISHDNNAIAGIADNVIITANDANQNPVTNYTGSITIDTNGTAGTITWAKISGNGVFADGGAAVDTATYTFDGADNGVVTLSIANTKSESFNISVIGDSKLDDDTEGNITVVPAGIDHFVIMHDGLAEAGIAENITITAKDAYSNTITDYISQIIVDTNGSATTITWAKISGNGVFADGGVAVDTATYIFDGADNGVVTLTIIDTKLESLDISVAGDSKTDNDMEGILSVGAGALDKFVIAHDNNAIAGTPESITITAYDVYNNIKTNYAGTITLDTNGTATSITWTKIAGIGVFNDGGDLLDSATYAFLSADNGTAGFTINDTVAESIDIDISGSGKFDDDTEGNLVVVPAGLDHFNILHDGSATAGIAENITITARDIYDNNQDDYAGSIIVDTNGTDTTITWANVSGGGIFNDNGASVDTAVYTYDPTDNGIVTLSVNDTKAETILISVSGSGKLDDDTDEDLTVNSNVLNYFVVSHDNIAIQSVSEDISVTAYDQYGNTKIDYTGTITLDTTGDVNNISWILNTGSGSFLDGGVSADTATYTYAGQDAGIALFGMTDNTAETLNIAVDAGGINDNNTEGDLVVQASSLTIDIIANALASGYIGQGASGYVLMDLTLTNNNVMAADDIQSIILNNTGTILDAQISSVKLYYDSNNSGTFSHGIDAQVGAGSFSGGSITFSDINVTIPIAGTEELYVTVDLAGTVTDGAIVDISVPVNGITFEFSPDAEDSILNSAGSYIVDSMVPSSVLDLATTSHNNAISIWNDPQSRDNTVTVSWSLATDSASGVDGYSVLWDNNPTTLPDSVKDIEQTQNSITSAALSDANTHYVHVRSVDNVGNWESTAASLGPFYIDTSVPAATSIYQIIEYAGGDYLSISGNTIYYSGLAYSAFRVYVSASDAGSGLKQALFPTTTSAGGIDFTEDVGAYQYLYTYEISAPGASYNNVNAVVYDNAGNLTNVPFSVVLDSTAPDFVTTLTSSSHTQGVPSVNNDIIFTWSDVSDTQSGVAGYSIIVNTNPTTIPPQYLNVDQGQGTYTASDLASGSYYGHIRSVDNVGNWSSTVTHAGPYIIGRGNLTAAITSSKNIISTDQQFEVTMIVDNTGSSAVNDVDPSTLIVDTTGAATAITSSNPAAQDIAPAGQKQFQWTYTAGLNPGTISFKGYAQGTDTDGIIKSSVISSNDITVEQKANLSLSVLAAPATVNTNENITIKVNVSNTGQADAVNVAPLLTPSGSAIPIIDSGPSPATATIKGGRSKEFVFIAHGAGAGVANFTATIAQGSDENSNAVLSVNQAQDSVTVQSPPSYELTSSISATPASVQPSGTITITMNVQNTGGSILSNVTPSSLAVGGTSSDAIYATGPTPANVSSLAAGAEQQFIWTYTAGSTLGTINFTGNANSTETASSATASSDITILTESAILISAIAATPASLLTNATITVTMTVTNTANSGGATAENVIPSILTIGGSSGEANLLTGPSPSSANIAPQAQQNFIWTYRAGITQGTVNFTGNASGTDSSDQADVSSAANTSANVSINTLNADWIYPTGTNVLGPIRSIPIAYWGMENKIYIGSDDNNLYILNGDTHELDASFTTSGKIRGLPYPSTDIDGADLKDIVYFGTVGKTVYGLWADNTLRWNRVMGEALTTTVLYDYVSGVYFGTTANNIYCIDAVDGTDFWGAPAAVGGAIESSPAMIYVPTLDYDEIYFGASDGKVYGFKAIDGTGARTFDTGFGAEGAIKTAPTITLQNPSVGSSRRLMLFGTANGKFYAVNTANLSSAPADTGWSVNLVSVGGSVYSAPWFDTDSRYVFFGSQDGKLYAVSIADGSMKANFPVDVSSPIDSWPLVENGIVYFGADNGKFYAVDADTGQIVPGWPYDTGDAIKGGAALHLIYNTDTWDVEETYVIVGSDSGKIYSFKAVK